MAKKILLYTRIPDNKFCLPSYGNSVHFSVSNNGEDFIPLNNNRGILYAKAEIDEKNQIVEKGLLTPVITLLSNGDYGIFAKRTDSKGILEENSDSLRLLWTTKDFLSFVEHGLVEIEEKYQLDNATDCIDISDKIYEGIQQQYFPIHNTFMDIPEKLVVSSKEELQNVVFTAHYSDGSTSIKKYDFDTSGVDFNCPGVYSIQGKIRQKKYPFPLAVGFADPVIFLWENKYYYIATNDNNGNIGFLVREADDVSDLFLPETKQHLILDKNPELKLLQTFWAPEFHVIGGRVYILFAVSGDCFNPQCHMMRLKQGGCITNADDWEMPVRVRKMDGTFLAEEGITLDMTHFSIHGESYFVWSYRLHCMAEGDTGSMLYIASTNPKEPWRLTSEPVLLSRPLYGWENVNQTINNEGPYALVTNDKVYISYSGGAATSWTYAVGMLSLDINKEPLNANNWKKSKYPALAFSEKNGIYGPGHNSFFKDKEGDTYIAYHAEVKEADAPRSSAIHRVHFNCHGVPVLNMYYDKDIKKEYRVIHLDLVLA